jgi:hypothetical protein
MFCPVKKEHDRYHVTKHRMKKENKSYWEALVKITRLFDRYDAHTLDENSRYCKMSPLTSFC